MTFLRTPQAVVVARAHGGWLAVSAADEDLRIGVVGADENEARHTFDLAAARWLELCDAAHRRKSHD